MGGDDGIRQGQRLVAAVVVGSGRGRGRRAAKAAAGGGMV